MSDAETRLALRMLAGSILNRFRVVVDNQGVDQDVSYESPLPVAIVSGSAGGGGAGDASAANQISGLTALGATNSAAAANETANTGLNGLLKGIFGTLRTWLPFSSGTRAYAYADGQRLTTSGAGQVRSTAVVATEVLLHASVRGFFRVGDSNVVASVGPGSIPLAADEKFHLRITSGQFISFVRDGGSDGSLSIMPVA